MDSTDLGNANKAVKQLSKNPMVPWKRLVDLNLDLMSISDKSSRIQNTYLALNHTFGCKANSKRAPENYSDDLVAATSRSKQIQNMYVSDSESADASLVNEEDLRDSCKDIKRNSTFKVADDIESMSPVAGVKAQNSEVNCTGHLMHDSFNANLFVNGANDGVCYELMDDTQCLAQQKRSSDEPNVKHWSSSLKDIPDDVDADLAIETERYCDNAHKKYIRNLKSVNSISSFNIYRDSINDDSGIATREYTVYSSKSELVNAETDLDYESDWDDTEVNLTADDTDDMCELSDENESGKCLSQVSITSIARAAELSPNDSRYSESEYMCELSDENESGKCLSQVSITSIARAAELSLNDSRYSESEIVNSLSCHSMDDRPNSCRGNNTPLFHKNIISINKSTHSLHHLETNSGDELNVEINIHENKRLKDCSPPKCSLSESFHSIRQEHRQVDSESCTYSTQSSISTSMSVDCLVQSGNSKNTENMTTVNTSNDFDSIQVKVLHSETENKGSEDFEKIDFFAETKNKKLQKNVRGNDLHSNIVTGDVSLWQHENVLKRFTNNDRDKSSDNETHYNELESHKQPKKLTRNPLTPWKHLVDANIESLAIKNAVSSSHLNIDQARLSIDSQSNLKIDQAPEDIDLNRQCYGFKNIDSSIIQDYIFSGIFTGCSSQEGAVLSGPTSQSDQALTCDCVLIEDLQFEEPRDGLGNFANKTDVGCRGNVKKSHVFVNLDGATDNQEPNEPIAASTSYQIAKHQIVDQDEDEVAKLRATTEKAVTVTGSIEAAAHHLPEIQSQALVEGFTPTSSMHNNYTKWRDDRTAMLRDIKSEHEHGNILLESLFENSLVKVQLVPDMFQAAKDESGGLPCNILTKESAGKYERAHSKVRQKRVNRSKPLTNRQRDRFPENISAKARLAHDKYTRHETIETPSREIGLVEFSRPKIETKTSESSDIIGTGWGKVADFIYRLVSVFNPSVQRYDNCDARDYPELSNVLDDVHEVYSENRSSHTNKSKLPTKRLHNYSYSLFEGDYVYSTSEEQFHTDMASKEPLSHKRSRKQRRRKEMSLPPSPESTIESTRHSFPNVDVCKPIPQYNQQVTGQQLQITDTNTRISDIIPTNSTFKIIPFIQDSYAWRCGLADESCPSTSSALSRSYQSATKCIDGTGNVKFQVQSDIPYPVISDRNMVSGSSDSVTNTGSRVSFNLESRQVKTAVVLDTKYATNENELSDFFSSNSANTLSHTTLAPGRKTPRSGLGLQEKAQATLSPFFRDLIGVKTSTTRLSLLAQTLPVALRSARGVDAVNASEEESPTKQSQLRRVAMTEDSADDDVAEVMTDDMLSSSLECLLETLIQRGKVSRAFVATVQGQVLAKTSGLLVSVRDVAALVCCLTSSYKGVARITLLTIDYQCFKLEQGPSLVGRAENSVFVARQGKQTIVVGFTHPSSPGSCIREIQELSLALGHRGL